MSMKMLNLLRLGYPALAFFNDVIHMVGPIVQNCGIDVCTVRPFNCSGISIQGDLIK